MGHLLKVSDQDIGKSIGLYTAGCVMESYSSSSDALITSSMHYYIARSVDVESPFQHSVMPELKVVG